MSLTEAFRDIVVARLGGFLNIAFCDNPYSLTCAIAGLGVDIVGGNVDMDFRSIRPRGVGQSLFTSLIRNSLCPTRGLFGCTSLYLDGEIRQTIEHIVGYRVLT